MKFQLTYLIHYGGTERVTVTVDAAEFYEAWVEDVQRRRRIPEHQLAQHHESFFGHIVDEAADEVGDQFEPDFFSSSWDISDVEPVRSSLQAVDMDEFKEFFRSLVARSDDSGLLPGPGQLDIFGNEIPHQTGAAS